MSECRLPGRLTALEIARRVRNGDCTATGIVEATLAAIAQRDPQYNSFTLVTFERARREAAEIDARRARGESLPPLAGVPYAVKNLFDIESEVTVAGGAVNADNAPASRDATLVSRMQAAGAVLVGALNMDEHAYGFTTENTHYGACRNPHDLERIAGGSSGGSGAAIAGGLVPLTLGSDTNGSIRVPSSLCGIFGLKPTYGRLSRGHSFPFVYSLDHLGPFANDVAGLAAAYDALQGPDDADHGCAQRPVEPVSWRLGGAVPDGARIGILGGYFNTWATDPARRAVQVAADTLGATQVVELHGAEQARAAAFIITASEGGALHRARLRERYADYEPLSRDRLVAGSLIPASWVVQAQRVRQRVLQEALQLFSQFDVLLAPATPVQATPIGAEWIHVNGQDLPCRPSMGLLTQPISCIGLPVCCAPIWPDGREAPALPIGVQLIAAPWREDLALAAAWALQTAGVSGCRRMS